MLDTAIHRIGHTPQTVTLSINTRRTVASLDLPENTNHGIGILALVFWLPGSFLTFFGLRSKESKRRIKGLGLVLFLIAGCGLFSLSKRAFHSTPSFILSC